RRSPTIVDRARRGRAGPATWLERPRTNSRSPPADCDISAPNAVRDPSSLMLLLAIGLPDPRQQSCGVKDKGELRRDVDERGHERVQIAKRREPDAERVHGESPDEVEVDDPLALARDANGFDEAREIVAQKHHVGALPRHVRTGSYGHSYGGAGQGGRIIHPVADHGDR